jgi:hypothetical protein
MRSPVTRRRPVSDYDQPGRNALTVDSRVDRELKTTNVVPRRSRKCVLETSASFKSTWSCRSINFKMIPYPLIAIADISVSDSESSPWHAPSKLLGFASCKRKEASAFRNLPSLCSNSIAGVIAYLDDSLHASSRFRHVTCTLRQSCTICMHAAATRALTRAPSARESFASVSVAPRRRRHDGYISGREGRETNPWLSASENTASY